MKCDICDHEFTIDKYGGGCCPKCGQEYDYDEGSMLILSDEQKAILRDNALRYRGNVDDNKLFSEWLGNDKSSNKE